MGGSDQWGNIVTGSEMIRRQDQGTAYAITTQLIKKADGRKIWKDRIRSGMVGSKENLAL